MYDTMDSSHEWVLHVIIDAPFWHLLKQAPRANPPPMYVVIVLELEADTPKSRIGGTVRLNLVEVVRVGL